MSVVSKARADEIHARWNRGVFMSEDLEEWFDNPHEYADFRLDGKVITDDSKYRTIGLSKREDLMCVFWGQEQNTLSYLLAQDKKDIGNQLKTWRKQYRAGNIILRECNNRDLEYKGRKFYSLIL